MKIFIILILGLFCVVDAEELLIQKQKEFQVEIEPNIYKSGFSIRSEEYEQESIEKTFQETIGIVKEYDICRGGQYNINPHYNKKRYVGYIGFDCTFKDKEIYEKLLDKIKSLDGKLSQRRIQQANSDDILELSQVKLEKKALAFPTQYIEFLQESLKNKKCFVSKITFQNRGGSISPYMLRSSEAATNSKVTLPIEEKVKHKMGVDYIFKCITK